MAVLFHGMIGNLCEMADTGLGEIQCRRIILWFHSSIVADLGKSGKIARGQQSGIFAGKVSALRSALVGMRDAEDRSRDAERALIDAKRLLDNRKDSESLQNVCASAQGNMEECGAKLEKAEEALVSAKLALGLNQD